MMVRDCNAQPKASDARTESAPRRHSALPPNLPPRGLGREAAAAYVGISPGKFDHLVDDGRMPKAVQIDGRKVWDLRALDRAFDQLGSAADEPDANEWDALK
jgi:predicted DNA-binding transcriptional regulator AlpA